MKTLLRRSFLKIILLAIVALFQSRLSSSAIGLIYSLNAQWSDSQNPNGAWSYNYNGTPIANNQPLWWGPSGWCFSGLGDGAILRGPSPAGMNDPFGGVVPPANDWLPTDVVMHALSIPYGGEATFLNVRWTSPVAGTIDILGRAWDAQIFADRDVAWMLLVDGVVIAQRNSTIGLIRTDAGAQFGANLLPGYSLNNISVDAGDVVEFRVLTQSYYGHFVGIEQTISLTPVPEPVVSSIALLGLAGFVATRKRRAKTALQS